LIQQQQQQQQQFLAQQLLMQQMSQINKAQPNQGVASNKKQREVYIRNLTCGVVSAHILTELVNGALGPLLPDALTNPPVVSVSMDNEGKFAFVEMRTEELATAALHLDKVELCGRTINVGRPKGYVDPAFSSMSGAGIAAQPTGFAGFGAAAAGSAGLAILQKAQAMNPMGQTYNPAPNPYGAGAAGGPYNPQMPNMPAPNTMPNMPNALMGMFGATAPATTVLYLENMVPSKDLLDAEERSDIAEDVKEECGKCGEVIAVAVPQPTAEAIQNGEPGKVYVQFKEQAGAIAAQRMLHGRTFSGNKVIGAFVDEGQFARAQAGEWMPGPAAPAPTEGYVKMRGLPFTATKQDIVLFFAGCGCVESGVSIVVGLDGRPTGEAYVAVEGPNADIRQALSKDRQMVGNRYVELFFSSKDEKDRRQQTGTVMI